MPRGDWVKSIIWVTSISKLDCTIVYPTSIGAQLFAVTMVCGQIKGTIKVAICLPKNLGRAFYLSICHGCVVKTNNTRHSVCCLHEVLLTRRVCESLVTNHLGHKSVVPVHIQKCTLPACSPAWCPMESPWPSYLVERTLYTLPEKFSLAMNLHMLWLHSPRLHFSCCS